MGKHAFDLEIRFDGLDDMIVELDNMIDAVDGRVQKAMNEYSALVEEGAKALTFRDYGDLEDSIHAAPAKLQNGAIEGSVGSNLSYALRLHEQPYKPGTRPKYDRGIKIPGYYVDGKGRRTRDKPTWRGEVPGRKYLTRAVDVTENDYEEIMAEALDDLLKGKGRRRR